MEGDKEEVLGHRRVSGCTEAASSSGLVHAVLLSPDRITDTLYI
jgi:hypothetical protein